MNRLQCLIRLARALDYNRDPDPKHWKTINGAKVHVDENGNYDGGAGGKFTGRHHYGPDWKQKTALMNQLTNALRGGVTQKQAQGTAQGNQTGNTSAQNVASKATSNGAGNGTMKEERRDNFQADLEIEKITNQIMELERKQKEYFDQSQKILHENYSHITYWGGHEGQQAKYYELLQKANEAKSKAAELAIKRGQMETLKEQLEKKTFVNSFGEATHRYIATTTYERQQKRLGKQIFSLLGVK